MTKPQRFKILRNADPEALAREVSEHLNGVEHTEEGKTKTYIYGLHGETRVVTAMLDLADLSKPTHTYEQNVYVATFFEHADRVAVEPAASEYTQ